MTPKIVGLMTRNGKRITAQRKKIIDILVENKDIHLSIDDIFDQARQRGENISIATIYRTMNLFEQIGAVVKNTFEDNAGQYEIYINDEKNHYHLICRRCHKIMEIPAQMFDELEKKINFENEFICENWDLKIYGYCHDCQDG